MIFSKSLSTLRRLSLNNLIEFVPPYVNYYLEKMLPRRLWTGYGKKCGISDTTFEKANVSLSVCAQSTGEHANALPEFINSGYLTSEEGMVAFKKWPNSPLLPGYFECQLEGMIYFDEIFRCAGGQHLKHGEIMVEHHRILASGLDGLRSYRVGLSKECSADVAGMLRHAGGRVAFPVRDPKAVNEILRALIAARCFPGGERDIKLTGLSREAWSKVKRVKRGLDIIHPDGKYIPIFFKEMGYCLDSIRQYMHESNKKGFKNTSFLLQVLATYFHLGIHSHSFVRINQSLLWSQVNYILMLNGFKPVHHGNADLVAAFLDDKDFCDYFSEYVFEHGGFREMLSPSPKQNSSS